MNKQTAHGQATFNRGKQLAHQTSGAGRDGRNGTNSIVINYIYIMSDKEQNKKIILVMCSCGTLINIIDILKHELSEEHIVYLYYRENDLYRNGD